MIYRLEAQQLFPRRTKIGARAVEWIAGKVYEWVAERVATSRDITSQVPPDWKLKSARRGELRNLVA